MSVHDALFLGTYRGQAIEGHASEAIGTGWVWLVSCFVESFARFSQLSYVLLDCRHDSSLDVEAVDGEDGVSEGGEDGLSSE